MASELILVLRDFFADDEAGESEQAVPRLPALELLLARAQRSCGSVGWRERLAGRFGGPALANLAPATVAAMAWLPSDLQATRQFWLATPVHFFAGLDSVRLHPAGLLNLSAEAQTALVADFGAVFAGDTAWALHTIGRRELLLSGAALAASAADPAQFLGRDPGDGLPRGAEAARLRRLGVEIEMWLHEHRINLERQQRGELPVNALWLWGSGPSSRPIRSVADIADADGGATLLQSQRLCGEDAFAEALWRLRAGRIEPLPERFERQAGAGVMRVVLYPTTGAEGIAAALQRFELHWLVPALEALRAGSLGVIELLAGNSGYRLRRRHLLRLWRTPRPWWQAPP